MSLCYASIVCQEMDLSVLDHRDHGLGCHGQVTDLCRHTPWCSLADAAVAAIDHVPARFKGQVAGRHVAHSHYRYGQAMCSTLAGARRLDGGALVKNRRQATNLLHLSFVIIMNLFH